MILFTWLVLTIAVLVGIALFMLAIGGAAFVAVFADVIVCAIFMGLIARWILKKRD